ncbi:MAG TPA: hypothetical protein VKP65_16325 [Rhodothermales bacterium]|nr:hypothetical protein [Rhodothermales bacterium]
MANRKVNKHILGVMVTSRAVHAALLEAGTDDATVVRRFMRPRSGSNPAAATSSLPELQSDDATDFSVQFTDGGSGMENMFLGSEFGGAEAANALGQESEKPEKFSTFMLELSDILTECKDAGFPDPVIVFAEGASDVNQVEIRVARDKNKKGEAKPASRNELMETLATQHSGVITEECVAFLSLTPSEEGIPRHLAIFPKEVDPVASTLATMREQITRQMPTVRFLDTEVSLYLGVARASRHLTPKKRAQVEAEMPDGPRNTLVVRAGVEDTLVLFMQDDTLRQSEILRSLTTYEAPETICSRVLLLQDEYGIGEVQQVLLLSEEREEDLVESFEMFFPDARVESMRQYMPEMNQEKSNDVATGTLVPAIAAALRISSDARYQNVFEDVNLLPKQLLRRRLQLPVTWQVLALYVLLFCTVLFFMGRYFTQQSQIAEKQRAIQQFEREVGPLTVDAKQLQASIDSLQAVHEQYMRSLNVLEGLLQGSDKWSRALEKSSREVAGVSGIWIESWNPRNGGRGLELSGNATARDHVVELAQRLDGTIATLTFSEIRDWPVYSFKLNMPLENGLPKAAEYLRKRAAEQAEEAAANVPVTSAALQDSTP